MLAGLGVAGGGGALHRAQGALADQAHQRHGQGAGAVRAALPGLGPGRAELAGRLAGAALRPARRRARRPRSSSRGRSRWSRSRPSPATPSRSTPRPRPWPCRRPSGAPFMIPPAASTGTSRIGLIAFDHLGHQHHGGDLAAVAAGLRALHHQDVDAGVDLADGVLLGADQGRHRHAVLLAHLDHRRRRHAERIGDQLDRVLERRLQHPQRRLRIERLRPVVGDLDRRRARRRPWPAGRAANCAVLVPACGSSGCCR